jgi:hypothetical protein
MRTSLLAILLAVFTAAAYAASSGDTDLILARAWPYAPYARLTELGT